MQTIELSENSIQIIEKQHITENTNVIIKVDIGSMPGHKAMKYMETIRLSMLKHFAPATVIVLPKQHSIEFVEKETDVFVKVDNQDGRNIFHVDVPDHVTTEQVQTIINNIKEQYVNN